MKHTLLFSFDIPENNRKRYKEASFGFNWLIVFYSFLVPFFKDSASKIGWLMVASQCVGFFVSGVLGDVIGQNAIPTLGNVNDLIGRAYINFLAMCFIWVVISTIWGYFYNNLYIKYLLEMGYISEDTYTETLVKKYNLTPKISTPE